MKNILQTDKLKLRILKTLKNEKIYTFYALRKATKSSYDTLKPNCEFLKIIGLISITSISKNQSATNTSYTAIKITKKGLDLINKLKKI